MGRMGLCYASVRQVHFDSGPVPRLGELKQVLIFGWGLVFTSCKYTITHQSNHSLRKSTSIACFTTYNPAASVSTGRKIILHTAWICYRLSASRALEAASTSAGTKSPIHRTAKITSVTVSKHPSDDGSKVATSTGTPKRMQRAQCRARQTKSAVSGSARRSCARSRRPRRTPWLQHWVCRRRSAIHPEPTLLRWKINV